MNETKTAEHATYWRDQIAAMSDEKLSKWIFGVARDKANAQIAARRWDDFPSDEDVRAATRSLNSDDGMWGLNDIEPSRVRAALTAVKTLSEKDTP